MTLAAAMAAGALSVIATAAQASVLLDQAAATPQMASPDFFDVTFDAAAGAGAVTFRIDGFNELDGANVVSNLDDVFTLSLNGVDILRGAWDLGGGGQNVVFFAPPGATAVAQTPGFGRGGTVDVTTSLGLAAGVNTLRFAYASAVPQGRNDESWAIERIVVTGTAPTTVPEPAAWALMLLGFGGVGATLRRRALA